MVDQRKRETLAQVANAALEASLSLVIVTVAE
jgi:hypothetical protein